jgi:hypothetical protein
MKQRETGHKPKNMTAARSHRGKERASREGMALLTPPFQTFGFHFFGLHLPSWWLFVTSA